MSNAPRPSGWLDDPTSPLRVCLVFVTFLGSFGALLFISAGRLDWVGGWLYIAVLAINAAINYAFLLRLNPDLIKHRMRMGRGTKTWDKIWLGAFTPVAIAIYVVAGLDAGRFGWSMPPPWLWPVGAVLLLCGTGLLTWSMVVNPFFEKTVRIQTEREHRVIDTGPYRFVRHPGYVAMFAWLVSAPMLLGSWWAFVPAILSVAVLIVRTALEDRTLRGELPGYGDYADRVRYRLIPFVW